MNSIYIVAQFLAVGCFLSLLNFYLSFLRYPVFRIRGGIKADYRWDSGYPVVGSLMILVCLPFVFQIQWLFYLALVVAVLDTGGLHWVAIAFALHALFGRKTNP